MPDIVIGLRGLAGSGKTEIAHALDKKLTQRRTHFKEKPNSEVLSFAGPIRDGLAFMGIKKTTDPVLYRKLAQLIGEEARKHDDDHWINLLKNSFAFKRTETVIIDDVRYENEGSICDLLFFLTPHGFKPADLGPVAGAHKSELWNRDFLAYGPRGEQDKRTILIENRHGEQDKVVSRILEEVERYAD